MPANPLTHDTSVLPGTHMRHVVVAARNYEVIAGAAKTFQPDAHRLPGYVHQFGLDGTPGLLLNNPSTIADTPAGNYVSDPDLDYITAVQFAIDGKIEQRSVAQSPVLAEPEANGPNLLLLQRSFRTNQTVLVPRPKFVKRRIHQGVTHCSSPLCLIYTKIVVYVDKSKVRKHDR